uniref:Bm13103 n=1 Tax=Brugia malayi TaxID=6279 RepID=A0A1I9G2G6_BRUMA|nr:Bm13103 [Brugia malayi]
MCILFSSAEIEKRGNLMKGDYMFYFSCGDLYSLTYILISN